ncbi:hypothetical protein GCM10007897_36010 [Sphingobium jiangsuense]|uniref:Uncharacterized protein n=1 Tax=Sphingobium jiangsuense TaxID=870476 RepID=A0A7W6BS23_9SPHN|nr:hypothetical protein [Sphingobium jiangsuense]MBB3928747.1 hypothetical protein [Sphingobium jiangsuense]GLT02196.1 hypothetical protein GCM10007897_36010 [Sphingobium jiangsuense]
MDRTAWEAAIAAERFARATMERYSKEIIQPLYAAQKAGLATLQQVFQAENDWHPYTTAHAQAVNSIILTPAPDLASVVDKIDLGLSDEAFDGSEDADRMLRTIADDIRRLTTQEGA